MELTAPEYRLSYLSVGAVVNGRTGFLVSPLPRFHVRTLLNGRRPNTYPSAAAAAAAAAARRSPRMAKGAVMVGEPAAGGKWETALCFTCQSKICSDRCFIVVVAITTKAKGRCTCDVRFFDPLPPL